MPIRAANSAAGALFAKLTRQVPGVLYEFRRYPDGRSCFPFASAGIRDIFEIDPADVVTDASIVFSRIHPADAAHVAETIAHSAQTLQPWQCVFRVVLPKAGERWLQSDANPERLDDGSVLWYGHTTDVTEAERARERLRESELRYRLLAEYAPEAILVYDPERDCYADANPAALRLYRLTREQFLSRNPLSLSADVQPDGRRSVDAFPLRVALSLEGRSTPFEWVYRLDDGEEILCEVRTMPLPWEGRTLIRVSITDIRERKRLEDTMRQLQAAIASSLSAIAIADLAGNLAYVNEAFLRLWGYERREQVIGRAATAFWRDPANAQVVVHALLTEGTWSGDLLAQRSDGSTRTMTLSANTFRNDAGAPLGLLASFVDVTEERQLQLQLQQAQRLESIGRLAGGVAHDFNNLLTVMKGNLELVALESGNREQVAAGLREVEHAVDSAARLTQQLLAFSRKQIIAPKVLDLNFVVPRTLGMLRRLLGEDIELHFVAGSDLGQVRFDPVQAEQILVNLAVNARDAMPNGGRLYIETANAVIDEATASRHSGMRAGTFVRLTVADTGCGMSDETREHAFEPFYTTKGVGEGTGLGLSMIHGAVLQNGGYIDLTSTPGQGTRFEIYFPVCTDGEWGGVHADLPPAQIGHEHIVLVEDDAPLRRLIERMLRQLGYEVAAMAGGAAALEYLGDRQHPCQLLLTDIIMPQMNGKVLADRVLAMRPGTRVLFMSGYTADVIAQHGVLDPEIRLLAKPFSLHQLASRIRGVFDTPADEPSH